jgi:hypothetical protein
LHKKQGGGFQLLIHFHNTFIGFKKIKGMIFPFKFIIKLIMASPLLIIKRLYKNPRLVPNDLTDLLHSYWTVNTQIGAMKINIPRRTFLATTNEINACKNKYITSGAKLSHTPSVIWNKARKPTNTSIAILDLELGIYD